MTEAHTLKLIGYWARPGLEGGDDGKEPAWPDIRRAVRASWRATEREPLVAYLRNGYRCRGFLGYSACRFRCRDTYSTLGTGELTDGEWIWPEGLRHYVERHGVMLPEEFVASAAARAWQVPPLDQVGALVGSVLHYHDRDSEVALDRTRAQGPWKLDFSLWLEWAKGLPEAPRGQSRADPGALKRFCLVLDIPSTNVDDEVTEAFSESVWSNVAEQYGRGVPRHDDESYIQCFATEDREAVLAAILDGLRRHGLIDHTKVIVGEPEPSDWQRDRDFVVWPR